MRAPWPIPCWANVFALCMKQWSRYCWESLVPLGMKRACICFGGNSVLHSRQRVSMEHMKCGCDMWNVVCGMWCVACWGWWGWCGVKCCRRVAYLLLRGGLSSLRCCLRLRCRRSIFCRVVKNDIRRVQKTISATVPKLLRIRRGIHVHYSLN